MAQRHFKFNGTVKQRQQVTKIAKQSQELPGRHSGMEDDCLDDKIMSRDSPDNVTKTRGCLGNATIKEWCWDTLIKPDDCHTAMSNWINNGNRGSRGSKDSRGNRRGG